jgi:hypothetical protein
MGSGGSAPQRNLYAETSDELTAKADLAPKVFATEAEYRPQYTALDLQNLEASLLGTKAGQKQLDYTEVVTKYRNPETGEMSDSPRRTPVGTTDGFKNQQQRFQQWEAVQVPVSRSRTVQTPAQMGLLDIGERIAKRASDVESAGISAQRSADIADVSKLGGLSLAAQQNADPRTAALIEALTTDASDELGMGYDMTPAQMRLAQQSVRSRGQGTINNIGPAGDLKEAIGVSEFAQNLRNSRRQFATGVTGLRSAVYGDAFNRVLSRPASASPQSYLSQGQGISASGGPRMFGSTINANDVFSSNQNASAANKAAQAQQTNTLTGAGIGAGAAIIAAMV